MCSKYRAYDFQIIKQSLCRFFQDKHIKVSLFLQDQIQSLDGTIYLNFAQEGTLFSERPGTVKMYDPSTGVVTKEKHIKLCHSDLWKPNPMLRSCQGTVNPHLGSNMYAQDRAKPPVPVRPEEKDEEAHAVK